ncbi:outer membrane beta-barrel protein [Thiofilum flexile]|uniref:outer membrane beta-barrel protein n=1 Tax=Thiofilum flexile TaxID=125627 RepID=UPI00037DB8F4|nr:outer membrane beta-barrel protein [Thiofilum flexile]
MKHYLPYLPAGLVLLASTNAMAGQYDNLFSTGVERITTSDNKTTHDSVSAQYKRVNRATGTSYGLRVEKHRFKNPQYRHTGRSVYLQGATHLSPNIQLSAGAGSMEIKRVGNQYAKKTFTPYHVGLQAQMGSRVQVGVRQERSPAYMRHALNDKKGNILTEDMTTAEIRTKPTQRTRFNAQHQNIRLSDGNRGRRTMVGAYYGITPNVWLGVEGSRKRYDRSDLGYKAPKNERNYAVTLDADVPLGQNAKLYGSVKAGRSKEAGYSGKAKTLYASLGAEFAVGRNTTLSANVYQDETRYQGRRDRERGAMLNLTYRWG